MAALPVELQLKIIRYLVRCSKPIILEGVAEKRCGISSGILTASKHLSELALGVFYGENVFELSGGHCHMDFTIDPDQDDDVSYRWSFRTPSPPPGNCGFILIR